MRGSLKMQLASAPPSLPSPPKPPDTSSRRRAATCPSETPPETNPARPRAPASAALIARDTAFDQLEYDLSANEPRLYRQCQKCEIDGGMNPIALRAAIRAAVGSPDSATERGVSRWRPLVGAVVGDAPVGTYTVGRLGMATTLRHCVLHGVVRRAGEVPQRRCAGGWNRNAVALQAACAGGCSTWLAATPRDRNRSGPLAGSGRGPQCPKRLAARGSIPHARPSGSRPSYRTTCGPCIGRTS